MKILGDELIKFKDEEHKKFFYEMLAKSGMKDVYHKALFYTLGLSLETRIAIDRRYDFKTKKIKQDGLYEGWQTSGSIRICTMAFNLWNGWDEGKGFSTPEELFCCGNALFFMEAIKLRHPEYCEPKSYIY
jgi:hypothetical protein